MPHSLHYFYTRSAFCRIQFSEVIPMEKKIDEAAVWQRVAGASAEAAPGSSPPVLVLPELTELLSDMERCSALLSRMTRSGVRGSAPLQQAQRQQVTLMRGITCLLSGAPQAQETPSLPGGTLSKQLIWLLGSMERTADRLDAIAPRTSGLVQTILRELAQQQRQSWSRAIALLGSILEG